MYFDRHRVATWRDFRRRIFNELPPDAWSHNRKFGGVMVMWLADRGVELDGSITDYIIGATIDQTLSFMLNLRNHGLTPDDASRNLLVLMATLEPKDDSLADVPWLAWLDEYRLYAAQAPDEYRTALSIAAQDWLGALTGRWRLEVNHAWAFGVMANTAERMILYAETNIRRPTADGRSCWDWLITAGTVLATMLAEDLAEPAGSSTP